MALLLRYKPDPARYVTSSLDFFHPGMENRNVLFLLLVIDSAVIGQPPNLMWLISKLAQAEARKTSNTLVQQQKTKNA